MSIHPPTSTPQTHTASTTDLPTPIESTAADRSPATFSTTCDRRLPNLFDEYNQATIDPAADRWYAAD